MDTVHSFEEMVLFIKRVKAQKVLKEANLETLTANLETFGHSEVVNKQKLKVFLCEKNKTVMFQTTCVIHTVSSYCDVFNLNESNSV